MRALYAERRDAFLHEARRRLSGLVTFPDVEAGMDAIGWLASATDDTAVSRRLGANGVDAPPLSAYSMRPCEPGLLFGFTAFTLPQTLAALEATERSLR
jgi:GntR family transcriptional regulator/MocR family aminotransferase